MLAPAADDDLGAAVAQAIVALEFLNDGFLEFGDAAGWSVFGEPVLESGDGRILDGLGGIKIGFTGSKADDILPGCPQLLGLGTDGQGREGAREAAR